MKPIWVVNMLQGKKSAAHSSRAFLALPVSLQYGWLDNTLRNLGESVKAINILLTFDASFLKSEFKMLEL